MVTSEDEQHSSEAGKESQEYNHSIKEMSEALEILKENLR
jgi:hypothetical protein